MFGQTPVCTSENTATSLIPQLSRLNWHALCAALLICVSSKDTGFIIVIELPGNGVHYGQSVWDVCEN